MSGVSARYLLRRGAFTLDAQLEFPGAGVTALFGPSGSGKTSLLRCVAGLEKPAKGYLDVNAETLEDGSAGVFVPPHLRSIGYVFQDARLFTHLDVRRNLEYGYNRTNPKDRMVEMERTVDLLGLTPLLDHYPSQLSGGQAQRVAIGRALLTSPKLLLLDEPVASLDEASKSEIFPYLTKLHDELSMPVLYISHSLDEVSRFADHLALMENGQILASGPLKEIVTSLDLPLAKQPDAGAVFETVVAGHDDEFNLTILKFPGGLINVARADFSEGERVRVRVIASDVAISLEKPVGTSVLNVFRARIDDVAEKGPSQMTLKMDLNGSPLLATITKKSKSALGLEPGSECYAMVKSVALVT